MVLWVRWWRSSFRLLSESATAAAAACSVCWALDPEISCFAFFLLYSAPRFGSSAPSSVCGRRAWLWKLWLLELMENGKGYWIDGGSGVRIVVVRRALIRGVSRNSIRHESALLHAQAVGILRPERKELRGHMRCVFSSWSISLICFIGRELVFLFCIDVVPVPGGYCLICGVSDNRVVESKVNPYSLLHLLILLVDKPVSCEGIWAWLRI